MWTKIEKLVDAKGLNWAKLARLIGESESRISKWRGGTGEPDRRQLLRIARALETGVEYLADDAQDEPPAPAAHAGWERTVIGLIRALRLDEEEAIRRVVAGGAMPPREEAGRPPTVLKPLPPAGPRLLGGSPEGKPEGKPNTSRKKQQG